MDILTITRKDGKLYLFYTGVVFRGGKACQAQCMAVSEDGLRFEKAAANPLIQGPPPGAGADFRDPKVIWAEGRYRMVCGGSDNEADDPESHGRIYLYSSDDLYHWTYGGILYEAKEGEGSMFECPDLFRLEDKWVITASPMHRKDFRQNIDMIGQMAYVSKGNIMDVEVLVDKSVYTLFFQGGRYRFTGTFFPEEETVSIEVLGAEENGNAVILSE